MSPFFPTPFLPITNDIPVPRPQSNTSATSKTASASSKPSAATQHLNQKQTRPPRPLTPSPPRFSHRISRQVPPPKTWKCQGNLPHHLPRRLHHRRLRLLCRTLTRGCRLFLLLCCRWINPGIGTGLFLLFLRARIIIGLGLSRWGGEGVVVSMGLRRR